MARGFNCVAHVHDDLVPIEVHHIHPTAYHGPDTANNKAPLCSNAHSDVHYLLEAMLKGKPVDRRQYGVGVRRIADDGYRRVMAYAESLAAQQPREV